MMSIAHCELHDSVNHLKVDRTMRYIVLTSVVVTDARAHVIILFEMEHRRLRL